MPTTIVVEDEQGEHIVVKRKTRLQQFLQLVRPYRWMLGQCLVIMLIMSGVAMVQPLLFAEVIGRALPNQDLELFTACLVGMLVVMLVGEVLGLLNGHLLRLVAGRVIFDIRRKMYAHVQRLSLSFFESRSPGEINSRLMGDTASIANLVTGTVLRTIESVFRATFILGLLLWMDWRIALIAMAVTPLHFLSYFLFERRLGHESWKATEKNSQINGKTNEVFDAAKVVKGYSAEQREVKTLVAQLREGYEISLRSGWLTNAWGAFTNSVSHVGSLVVMVATGLVVIWLDPTGLTEAQTRDQVQQGVVNFSAMIAYVGMLYAPISQLINVVGQIIPARVGLQRVYEILDLEQDVVDKPDALHRKIKGDVKFEQVCFAYPMDKQVLSDISFTASTGQVIALVGPSGAGKTTVANLIARFYEPTAGHILIDDIDITDYAVHSLRNQMSLVLQETYLFRGTVRENLLYGKPNASEDEVINAAMLANAHEFIQAMPYGYDTIIGAHGARLSGGQRQRLAIARALIRDPRLLILDEATSALDTASEMKVQEALATLMNDRTTFIIAHRLSTIKDASQILVMEKGHIVQRGTYGELIERDGLFRKLYDPKWAKEREEREEEELKALSEELKAGAV
ncbi:MAG: ABC transporter ATP-binding protein [Proteobacteria bacterium]|nr:ABC transporter ATP-binding protein [Pseudomonadota bacterium]